MLPKNPFLFTPVTTFILKEKYKTISVQSGVTTSYTVQETELDRDESVKLFKLAEIRQLHKLLSKPGMELFLFVLGNSVRKNKDFISLSPRDDHDMSSASYHRGVESLITNSLLAKRKNGEYWINPHLFFPGSRVKALKELYGDEATAPVNPRPID